jgi:hypothetical protein
VAQTIERASSLRRDGELVGIETIAKYVIADLGYVVQIERAKAKIGAREDITPYAVRATNIFRREDGVWKMVHRHADRVPSEQSPHRGIDAVGPTSCTGILYSGRGKHRRIAHEYARF